MSIDREQVNKAIYGGLYEPATALTPPSMSGTQEGICGEACEFSPSKAKALLKRPAGSTAPSPSSTRAATASTSLYQAYANQIRQNLGVNTVAKATTDWASYYSELTDKKIEGPHFGHWGALYASQQNTLRALFTKAGGCAAAPLLPVGRGRPAPREGRLRRLAGRSERVLRRDAEGGPEGLPGRPTFFDKYAYVVSDKIASLPPVDGSPVVPASPSSRDRHHPMDQRTVLRLAAEVPDRDGFPLVDDLHAAFDALAAAHPEQVTVTRIGTSRLGEPLHSYRIGSGSHAAVIVGGVHPNEPIGSWTALHLATWLLEDAATAATLDTTWRIVPTIDPDGMRLNEAWFHDPHDRVSYARHFHRPAPDAQVEWTFPEQLPIGVLRPGAPGDARVHAAHRRHPPDLLVSLHNGEMGGVYYYLSEDLPDVVDTLHAVPTALGLPLDTGEPESPQPPHLAPRCSRWTASRSPTST